MKTICLSWEKIFNVRERESPGYIVKCILHTNYATEKRGFPFLILWYNLLLLYINIEIYIFAGTRTRTRMCEFQTCVCPRLFLRLKSFKFSSSSRKSMREFHNFSASCRMCNLKITREKVSRKFAPHREILSKIVCVYPHSTLMLICRTQTMH